MNFDIKYQRKIYHKQKLNWQLVVDGMASRKSVVIFLYALLFFFFCYNIVVTSMYVIFDEIPPEVRMTRKFDNFFDFGTQYINGKQ